MRFPILHKVNFEKINLLLDFDFFIVSLFLKNDKLFTFEPQKIMYLTRNTPNSHMSTFVRFKQGKWSFFEGYSTELSGANVISVIKRTLTKFDSHSNRDFTIINSIFDHFWAHKDGFLISQKKNSFKYAEITSARKIWCSFHEWIRSFFMPLLQSQCILNAKNTWCSSCFCFCISYISVSFCC